MKKIFRYILIFSTVLSIALWMLPYVDYMWLSSEVYQILDYNGYGSVLPHSPLVYWFIFISWLCVSVGLFFFNKAARTGFIILSITSIVASPFWGVLVMTPAEVTLFSIVAMSDGAIITMIYLSSIAKEFK